MADVYMRNLTPFAGVEIQDTDIFWISIDNGDTTFSSQKISGADMKALMPNTANVYTMDDIISVVRTITIDDSTGKLNILSTKTAIVVDPNFVTIERYDVSNPTLIRRISFTSSQLLVTSDKITYDNHQIYQDTGNTASNTPTVMGTYTPSTASNFVVHAEVKGYCAGTNAVHYSRIINTYHTVASVPVLLNSETNVNSAGGMSIDLVINGTNIDLEVTGVLSDPCAWSWITKVF